MSKKKTPNFIVTSDFGGGKVSSARKVHIDKKGYEWGTDLGGRECQVGYHWAYVDILNMPVGTAKMRTAGNTYIRIR